MKDDLKEFTALKKKVFELEDALKTCTKDKEIMKDQLNVLVQKVQTLQNMKDPLNSKNGDSQSEESTAERINCRK